MRTLLALLLLATPALAGQYQAVFLTEDCQSIARWELWGQRASETAATKRADILPTDLTAPCSESVENVGEFTVNLRRGTYTWTLRAVGTEGATADSPILANVIPMPKPTLKTVR